MPTVVFVDDSETALASTKMAVGTLPIEIAQYLSVDEAMGDIRSKAVMPDLIITDLNMPGKNGFDFLAELREVEHIKRIPVLMLTTETSPEMKKTGKELGLTGWIVKPFKPNQLKQAINRVLRLG
jgi:two-component system chemotaxis response regulator CheY